MLTPFCRRLFLWVTFLWLWPKMPHQLCPNMPSHSTFGHATSNRMENALRQQFRHIRSSRRRSGQSGKSGFCDCKAYILKVTSYAVEMMFVLVFGTEKHKQNAPTVCFYQHRTSKATDAHSHLLALGANACIKHCSAYVYTRRIFRTCWLTRCEGHKWRKIERTIAKGLKHERRYGGK